MDENLIQPYQTVITVENTRTKSIYKKESLNNDVYQFHQYQQNEQSSLILPVFNGVVCPSSIYGFSLPLWHRQTLLVQSNVYAC
jgi:hypothetical protein